MTGEPGHHDLTTSKLTCAGSRPLANIDWIDQHNFLGCSVDVDLLSDWTEHSPSDWLMVSGLIQNELRAFGNVQCSWLSGGRRLSQGI